MTLLLLAACHAPAVDPDDTSPATDPTGTTDTAPTDTAPTDTDPTDTTPPDPVATDFALTVDDTMHLLLHATWTSPDASAAWVEYRFEGGDWRTAPEIGPGAASVLGIPASTEVEARATFTIDGATVYGPTATATTGEVPAEVMAPTIVTWSPDLADPAPYGMIVMAMGPGTFDGPFYLTIFDRTGRIVWYQGVPDGLMSFNAAPARDGTHLWFEQEKIFFPSENEPAVTRLTLDRRWSTVVAVPNLGQAVSEGPDDSFFVEHRASGDITLQKVDAAGQITTVWDCAGWFNAHGLDRNECLMNTDNWDPTRNTVLVSQFETSTVFEIDVATGQPIRQMGQLTGGTPYTFDPPESNFAYQHAAQWTDTGTLIVSTHVPCDGTDPYCNRVTGQSGIQLASEYTVDDATRTLTRVSSYQSTDRWATQWGEAYRLPHGNLIQGYGQDGAVREVTPAGEVAWEAEWAKGTGGYRLIGHFSLIDDLYALNQGR